MKIGSLKEHPDFRIFLAELEKVVDNTQQDVLKGARNKTLDEFRYQIGRLDALSELYRELKERS